MRKSTIFIIAILYLISIVVVTFFGLQISVDQFKIYMTEINITTYDEKVGANKYKYVTFDENEINSQGYVSVFIDYEVGPSNASNPELVDFELVGNTYEEDGETKYYAKITSTGELMFFKPKMVIVTVRTTDGSAKKDTVMVKCVMPSE